MARCRSRQTLLRGNAQTELDDAPFGNVLIQISMFLLGSGARYHAAQLKYGMTGYKDIIDLQLPRRLTFLYPLARLPMWALARDRAKAPRPPNPAGCPLRPDRSLISRQRADAA